MKDKTIIITAGGTREKIDPVRFIGNRSSGKMGFALTKECLAQEAKVVLITTNHFDKDTELAGLDASKLEVINVESAEEMKEAVIENFVAKAEALIMAAAVADYRPKQSFEHKLKKETNPSTLTLELEKTTDILKEISSLKNKEQVILGFAVETERHMESAEKKLKEKNLDMIAVNSVDAFEQDESQVTLLLSDELHELGIAPKFTRMLKQPKEQTAKMLCYHLDLILQRRTLQST